MSDVKTRSNYFHNLPGEDKNVDRVIYKTAVPKSSIGYEAHDFFNKLGEHRNDVGSRARNAEQEYLLQGMPKGAMHEAAAISNQSGVGIAVRPTGVLAHMGIESGDPTKAQEFKNKTSKELDLFLCDELEWQQIGTVVHYDPRVGWSSKGTTSKLSSWLKHRKPPVKPTEQDWINKQRHIINVRMPQLLKANLKQRLRFWPSNEQDWGKLKGLFEDRVKEYQEQDYEYRHGHYKAHATVSGIYLQTRKRKGVNMVGDHDLFGFTRGGDGRLVHDSESGFEDVQKALQRSPTFQAQHGGIWNWVPGTTNNQDIRRKIMGGHSAPNGDPLLYIQPGFIVTAVFYVPGEEILKSVWDCPDARGWLNQTFSGRN